VQSGPDDKKDVRNGKKLTNIAACFDALRAKTPRKITRIFRGVELSSLSERQPPAKLVE
jgi:hypothetical protein